MNGRKPVATVGPILSAWVAMCLALGGATVAVGQEVVICGEPLDPATYAPGVIESMEEAIERDHLATPPSDSKDRNGRHGAWVVPNLRATGITCSGTHHVVNKWGDTRMGIGFPRLVEVRGAFLSTPADAGAATPAVRAIGYRHGRQVARTDWFDQLDTEPRWFSFNLVDVDRIEMEAVPAYQGAGWYALDDLTFAYVEAAGGEAGRPVVVNFDDLAYDTDLTDSGYAGLIWESGKGDFPADEGVPAPQTPATGQEQGDEEGGGPPVLRDLGTPPNLIRTFQGVLRGDAGSMTYPPDTDGAIGPNHYVETVNRNFAVYDKTSGAELVNILLGTFLPGSNGDPRVLFDQYSGRWIVLVTDFNASARIYLAVSLTSDPTGSWYKTSFVTAQGSDAGRWPDYPTLGVDADGIYTAAYMVGANVMTIFAIDKAPLIAATPSLGTVTAFRNLPWEGAIQPAHTYGTAVGEYLVSRSGSTGLRVRRVNPPLTAPTLTEVGVVTVPSNSDPPDAPALGSSVGLNTVDARPMMSVYRDGSLWTAHTVAVSGRAACRWYQIRVNPLALVQYGTVADTTLHYFFPSIMVNDRGDAVLGCTGSSAAQYAACYYTGRLAGDPLGGMATPVMFKAGTGAQNNVDSYGRNRWGDYSYTTLDPNDQRTFYCIQEYGHASNIWGTYVAVLTCGSLDCNENGIPDECDLDCGPAGGECDLPGCGGSGDCNANGIPDDCEPDCNGNGLADDCDIAAGTSADCQPDGIPDECQLADNDCNGNLVPDDCDIASGVSADCEPNGVPDDCEPDCNGNGIADPCDLAQGTSLDCLPDGIPDECQLGDGDCNGNGIPDACDLVPTEEMLLCFGLDTDPGWSTEGVWAFGQPMGGGSHMRDPVSGCTGPYVYGYNLTGDYVNNMTSTMNLTSTPVDCSVLTGTQLRFRRWLGVERFDRVSVQVSADGQNFTTVWQNSTTVSVNDYQWSLQTFDISSVADAQPTVYLRWGLGPTDGSVTYPGWNIDDVEVSGLAAPSLDGNGNGMPDECDDMEGGDFDADGDVDLDDYVDFVACLTGPGGYPSSSTPGWAAACLAAFDADMDGDVDLADFAPFQAAFTSGR